MAEGIRLIDKTSGQPSLGSMDSLDEIAGWLGTFRERLRQARAGDRPEFEAIVNRLEARYRERRAELA